MSVMTFTRAQLLTDVRRIIQDVAGTRFKEAWLQRWADEAVTDIATRTQCLKENSTAESVSGQQSYSLPPECIAGWAISKVEYDGQRLEEQPWDRIRDAVGVDASVTALGTPRYYSLYGRNLLLTKIPNAVKVMKIWFAKIPRAFTGSADTIAALGIPTSLGPAVEQAMAVRAFQLAGDTQKLGEAMGILDKMLPSYTVGKLLNAGEDASRGTG